LNFVDYPTTRTGVLVVGWSSKKCLPV
jgi:hypothetical protein